MADNTTPSTETEEKTTTPQNVEETDVKAENPEPEPAQSGEKDIDYWKRRSRENERRSGENYKKLQEREATIAELNEKLAAKDMENARMKLQQKYPQIDDSTIDDLCSATTPEGLNEWAEKFMKHLPATAPEQEKDVNDEEGNAGDKSVSQMTATALTIHNQAGKSVNTKPARGEAYRRKRAELEAKRERLNGSGKNKK